MARVPQYQGGQVLPSVRPSARVSGAPSPQQAAIPGQQLQELSQGLGAVGNAIGRVASVEQDKINKVRFNDAYNQALSEANRLKNEMGQYKGAEAVKGINGRPLTVHYRDELSKAISGIANGLTAPVLKDGFALAASDLESKFSMEAESYEVEQGQIYADQVRDATVLSAFDAVAANPSDPVSVTASLARARDALKDKFSDAGYDGDALDQQVKTAMAKAHNAVIGGMLEQENLAGAKAYFEAHKDDYLEIDAQAVPSLFARTEAELRRKKYESLSLGIQQGNISIEDLATAHGSKEIDDGEYAALLGQAAQQAAREEAEQKARLAEWRDRNFAVLQVGISDGTMTRADADLMYEKGQITPSQWSQAARMGADKSSASTALGSFMDYYSKGLPIDPANSDLKKGADEFFRQIGGADLFVEDFAKGMEVTTKMARDVGIIPSDAASVLRGYRANGSQQQQIGALKAIGDLYAVNQVATERAFTAEEVSEALQANFLMASGIGQQEVHDGILKAREIRANPDSVGGAMMADARKITNAARKNQQFVLGATGIMGGSLAQETMLKTYEEAFQNGYIQHGNAELAQKQADAVVGRTYGPSIANGGKMMMHPPEKYYPNAGDWIQDSLVAGVSELAGAKVEAKDIQLVSDAMTTQAILNTGKPNYGVLVRVNGIYQPISPGLRWTYDEEASKEFEKTARAANAWEQAKQDEAGAKQKKAAQEKRVKALERAVEWSRPQEDSIAWANMSAQEKQIARDAYQHAKDDLRKAKREIGAD